MNDKINILASETTITKTILWKEYRTIILRFCTGIFIGVVFFVLLSGIFIFRQKGAEIQFSVLEFFVFDVTVWCMSMFIIMTFICNVQDRHYGIRTLDVMRADLNDSLCIGIVFIVFAEIASAFLGISFQNRMWLCVTAIVELIWFAAVLVMAIAVNSWRHLTHTTFFETYEFVNAIKEESKRWSSRRFQDYYHYLSSRRWLLPAIICNVGYDNNYHVERILTLLKETMIPFVFAKNGNGIFSLYFSSHITSNLIKSCKDKKTLDSILKNWISYILTDNYVPWFRNRAEYQSDKKEAAMSLLIGIFSGVLDTVNPEEAYYLLKEFIKQINYENEYDYYVENLLDWYIVYNTYLSTYHGEGSRIFYTRKWIRRFHIEWTRARREAVYVYWMGINRNNPIPHGLEPLMEIIENDGYIRGAIWL